MVYKLLAINIDGALLGTNRRLSKVTKDAIQYVKDKGVYVVLVTNRNFPSAKKVAKALKLNSLIIAHDGAFIGDNLDEPFFVERISETSTIKLTQLLEGFECNVRLMHERYSIGNRVSMRDNMIAKAVLGNGDPLFYPLQFVDSLPYALKKQPVAPPHINVYFPNLEEKKVAIIELIRSGIDIDIHSINDTTLRIMPKRVNKARGLQILGQQVGIHLHEMIAIGNGHDDIELIRQVGLGVAMGNSPHELKKAADWVTRSAEQHGVAYVIREHFRKQYKVQVNEKNH